MGARVLTAAVFAACAGVVFWLAFVHTVHRGTLAVPDLEGMQPEEARRVGHDLGLTVQLEEPGVFSANIEPGNVASQRPPAGFHVKTGSTVSVRLSLGSERAVIPELAGETLQSALHRLETAGLVAGSRVEVRAADAGDRLVASDPPAGSEVAPGSEIDLLVNTTPIREQWVMPSLLLRPVDTARRFCRSHRLRLGQVHEVLYPGLPGGVVLRQYPAAGSPVTRSDIVAVWVSR